MWEDVLRPDWPHQPSQDTSSTVIKRLGMLVVDPDGRTTITATTTTTRTKTTTTITLTTTTATTTKTKTTTTKTTTTITLTTTTTTTAAAAAAAAASTTTDAIPYRRYFIDTLYSSLKRQYRSLLTRKQRGRS